MKNSFRNIILLSGLKRLGLGLVFSIIAMAMISCGGSSSNEEDSYTPSLTGIRERIVGKWTIQCVKKTKKTSNDPEKDELVRTYCFKKWQNGTTLNFNTDGTYEDSSSSGRHKWQFTNDGDLHMEEDIFEYTEEDSDDSYVKTEDEEYYYYWCWHKEQGGTEPESPGEERCLSCDLPYTPPLIPIWPGNNPPNIEGVYLLEPITVVEISWHDYKRGENLNERDYIKFSNQNVKNNTLDYENNGFDTYRNELCNHEKGTGVYIQGSGNNFTMWYKSWGSITGTNVSLQFITVISGTKTSTGIRNMYYMTMCIDRNGNVDESIIPVGGYEIYKDGDTNSPLTTWRSKAPQTRASVSNTLPWNRWMRKKN